MLVYTGVCIYTGIRLSVFIRYFLPAMKLLIFLLPYLLLCYILIFAGFFRFPRMPFLRYIGIYWIAVYNYLFIFLAAFDIIKLVIYLSKKSIITPWFNTIGTAAAIIFCILLIIYGNLNARLIHTVNYRINMPGSGRNFRIALISDTHIGATVGREWTAKIVDIINSTKSDMVCITGDIFDGNLDRLIDTDKIIMELKRIEAPLGVYACLGNHDVDRISISSGGGNERITSVLHDAGIIVLEDKVLQIESSLIIAGRKDSSPIGMIASRKTPEELLAYIDKEKTLIVMDHKPDDFPEIEKAGGSLTLSGHTHRGQIFPASLLTYFIFKRAGGAHYGHWKGTTMQAVITSGAGIWGPPLRIGTKNEVAVIDINFASE